MSGGVQIGGSPFNVVCKGNMGGAYTASVSSSIASYRGFIEASSTEADDDDSGDESDDQDAELEFEGQFEGKL